MATALDLMNPETLKARWPRFSAALARHDLFFTVWDRLVAIAEANCTNGQRLSLALRRCPEFAPLPAIDRGRLIKEALADRREIARQQSSLMPSSPASFTSDFMRAEIKHAFEQGKRVTVIHLARKLKAERMDMRVKNSQHLRWLGREDACFEELIERLS